jgi:phage terminase small subunit
MLTPKQEAFCQAVVSGKTLSDAYRSAYSASKMQDNTINTVASKLMSKYEISIRVDELKAQLSEKLLWTREDSLKTLIAVINAPDNAGNIISSVQAINKMQGFDAAEKHELSGNLNVSITIRGR